LSFEHPIKLLDKEFLPGQSGIIDLPIGSMIDYQAVNMTVHIHRSKTPGPSLLLTAGLHGDEIIGVEILRRLLKSRQIRSLRGNLIVVPVVNMPAFLNRSRYLPDRRDLNRLFPGSATGSLGARLAFTYASKLIDLCTHAIDIHAGAVGRPNLPQIRVSPGDDIAVEMAKAFKPPVVIETGLREGSLRSLYYHQAKPSILYEADEAHRLDNSAVRYGYHGILSVMRYLEMLPQEKKPARKMARTVISESTTWVRTPRGGIITSLTDLGKAIVPGDVLGIVADPFGKHETKIVSKVEGIVIGINREGTADEGDAMFHIATTHNAERAEARIQHSDRVLPEETGPGQ